MSDSPWLEGPLCSRAAAGPGQVARGFVRLRLQNVQGEGQDPFFTHLQTFYIKVLFITFLKVIVWWLQQSKWLFLTSWFSWALSSGIFPLSVLSLFPKFLAVPSSSLPTTRVPIFLKAPTTLTAGSLQLVFTHQGTQQCFLSGNAKPLSF